MQIDNFLQSPQWKNIIRRQGYDVVVLDHSFAKRQKRKFGLTQLYVGRVSFDKKTLDAIDVACRAQRCDSVVIDLERASDAQLLLDNEFHRIKDVQPSTTLLLDLTKTEDVLLAEMHQKTRYNIRLALKKGVTTRRASQDEFPLFWELLNKTYERQGIAKHPKQHYEAILQEPEFAYLVFAEYEGRVIGAHLMTKYESTVTYLHGGFDKEYASVMAPYLLQWEEIQRVRNEGYAVYDFWGISPVTADESHPLAGVTRFKKGFGGEVVSFGGAYEKIYTQKYKLYSLIYSIYKKMA